MRQSVLVPQNQERIKLYKLRWDLHKRYQGASRGKPTLPKSFSRYVAIMGWGWLPRGELHMQTVALSVYKTRELSYISSTWIYIRGIKGHLEASPPYLHHFLDMWPQWDGDWGWLPRGG